MNTEARLIEASCAFATELDELNRQWYIWNIEQAITFFGILFTMSYISQKKLELPKEEFDSQFPQWRQVMLYFKVAIILGVFIAILKFIFSATGIWPFYPRGHEKFQQRP